MMIIEWVVWSFLMLGTILMALNWFINEKKHQTGKMYDTNVVLALVAIPRIAFWETIVLLAFIFIDINKLHLIWIYPIVYFFIGMKWAKRINKKGRN